MVMKNSMRSGISVKNLFKSFGKIKVLNGISFEVSQGSIVALLGPNGAGKTTTINILSTLLLADSGSATVAGYDVGKDSDKVRASIGLTGQFAAVDEFLTGRENLELIAKLYHIRSGIANKAQQLLEQLELTEAASRPVRTYSGGMKRRLDLAMSLIASPSVIFLDEPTTGLDPRSRLSLWNMIRQLAQEGKTILLTTQHMEEADNLAENIVVIDHGQVIAGGTPTQLKSRVGAERVEIILRSHEDVSRTVKLFDRRFVTADQESKTISVSASKGILTLKQTIEKIEKTNIEVSSIALRQPTLDDVFLTLTGHEVLKKSKDEENNNGKP